MKLKDLISLTEKYFPLNYAYEWDNPGLLIGDENREVKKILLSLDITEENLDFAIKNGVNTILTHHPVIFSGVKNINTSTKTGRILLKAAENKISVYSAHTNMMLHPTE